MGPTDRARAAAVLEEAVRLAGDHRALAPRFLDYGRILALAPGQWAQAETDEAGVLVVLDGAGLRRVAGS